MRTRHLVRAALLVIAGALASCAGGGRGPVSYAPESSSYPSPGPPGDPWGPYIDEASSRFGVPGSWIRAVMHQESGGLEYLDGRPITSSAGAIGLMQLMPDTYADLQAQHDLGGDPYDPHDNILAGTAYIRQMYDKYGSPGFLAAYNAGPARVDDYLAGTSGLPAETVDYVAAITPHLGDDRAPVAFASAAPSGSQSEPLAEAQPVRVAAAGCSDANPDAAYDPSLPCPIASATPVERADPVSRDCIADPDAAFDPDHPCMTAPAVQTVSYQTPRPVAPVPALPPSALGVPMAASPYAPAPRAYAAPPAYAAPRAYAANEPVAMPAPRYAPPPVVPAYGSWEIQVGAFGQPQEAHFATDIARDALSRRFGATRPSIEPVRGLGGQLLYRARLAGLDQPQAASACALLRGQGLPCLTVSPGA